MSFWDDIFDFASDAWDFAKENPATAGAVAGGAYNLATGKNVLEGAGAGAVLGYGAGRIFGGGTGGGGLPEGTTGGGGSGSANVGSWAPTVDTNTLAGVEAASSGATQAATTGDFGGYMQKAGSVLSDAKSWGKKNADLVQLGIQGATALHSADQNEKLNQMRQSAVARQSGVNAKNDAIADAANADATKMSASAAAYDPRALGVRSMAQEYAAGGRELSALDSNRNIDPTAKAALKTKSKVATSKAAVSGYNSGYDTGVKTQAGLYSSADSLRRNYGGSGYDSTLAGDIGDANKNDSGNLTALLENYLGNPSAVLAKKKAADQGVMQ